MISVGLAEFFTQCLPRPYVEVDRNGTVTFQISHPTRMYGRAFTVTREAWLEQFPGVATNDDILQNKVFRNHLTNALGKFSADMMRGVDLEQPTRTEYLRELIFPGVRE